MPAKATPISPDWFVGRHWHKPEPTGHLTIGPAGSRRAAAVRFRPTLLPCVARVKGAIGYVEYTYAVRSKLTYALVRNRAGNFVAPDTAGLQAATERLDWAKDRDFHVLLSDRPAANAYPIMAMSFGLMHGYPKDPERGGRTLAVFRCALDNGQDLAGSPRYLPLPPALTSEIEAYRDDRMHGAKPTAQK